jgi:hypothetical protein
MREIKRESLIDTTDVLLYDILQELKRLGNPQTVPTTLAAQSNTQVTGFLCKYCGERHEKPQQIAACGQKRRK